MMVSAQIDAHLPALTPAERRVAAVVADDPEAVAFGTVADVARRAGLTESNVAIAVPPSWLKFPGDTPEPPRVSETSISRVRLL